MQPIITKKPRRKTMEPKVGQLISNKYRLVRLIGDGGMGSVYEARHELLGTTVALKFLHGALARRKGLVERFLQEAQVSARIKSQHVVTVSDVDRTPDGLAYMVMEFVDGNTLQTLYEQLYQAGKRLSYADAFRYMLQMCEGVRAAHKLGIVHRDLKPDNVMLTADGDGGSQVMLLDFGIAKLKASGEVDRGLTRPGVVMGTPEYMAPEQAFSADKVDKRADIFSLGVMFFEMLAGRRPVGGDNAHAIAAQYLEGTIAKLRDLAPSIDPTLAEAVHRAMAAKPSTRFDTVSQFRDAIMPFAPDGAMAGIATPTPAPISPAAAAAMSPAPVTPGGDRASSDRVSPVPKTVPPAEESETSLVTSASSLEAAGAAVSSPDPDADVLAATSDGDPLGNGTLDSLTGESVDDPATAVAGAITNEPEIHPGEDTDAARAEANAVRGSTEMAGPAPGTLNAGPSPQTPSTAAMEAVSPADVGGQDPLRAGTEPMPKDALAGVLPVAGAGQSSGTQAGDPGFTPPDFGSQQFTPNPQPAAIAPVDRRRGGKKRGPSFLSILLIASALSAMVVGGLYLAHEASMLEDHHDDPPAITFPTEKKKKKKEPSTTSEPDPIPDPVPDPIPEPTPNTQPPPKPTQPRPQPPRPNPGPGPGPKPGPDPKPQPSTQPPIVPPLVVPSVLPPIFPIPGVPGPPRVQPKPPAPAPKTNPTTPPKTNPAPAPRPGTRPPISPRPRTGPAPKPAPAPTTQPRRRRRFPRVGPRRP